MSLTQFMRILWARKLLILGAALFCLAGGIVAVLVVPSRWKAEADVYLNLLKPDPVTGEIIGPSARSYVATQVKLITDYSVAGLAVDKLGWLSDPTLIQQYQRRSQSDTRDFRRWLAQRITDGIKADILDGSNILGITYTGSNPEGAKAIANAVLQAYLDTSVAFKRADANKNADWYALQSEKLKTALIAAQTAETNYERENGIVMQDDKTDVDSARLAALATQGDVAAVGGGNSNLEGQLAETDAAIRQAAETLGPNHPQLLALKAKRASLMAMAAQEASPRSSMPGSSSRVAAAKAVVIGNRDKLAKLKILQSEVDVRQDQYNKSLTREADFRQQAAIVDAGLTALGTAFVPQSPSFPNRPLIVGGSLGLGLVFGVLIALLVELLDRRVRSPEDLTAALGLPVLAVLRTSS
jgi:succinoglycan biosynthesis transport protein ExoP